jgi:hypothetical protein
MEANLHISRLPASHTSRQGVIPPSHIWEGLEKGRLSGTTIILTFTDLGKNLFY